MEPLVVLIADDHPLFRNGMRALLTSVPDLEVAGEATTGDEVIRLAEDVQPDVVLMDLKMPGLGGIEATRRILGANPHVRILVVTMFEDDESVFAALRAGARGYVLKGASPDEMLRAIRATGSGEAIFSPAIAQRLIEYFTAPRPTVSVPPFPELTDREREILTLIAQGRANPEIRQELGISLKTVRNHISNIFSKLQVADRAEAIIRAREVGLGGERL
jgi:DNA-binding NarL/FixJ family response regulator